MITWGLNVKAALSIGELDQKAIDLMWAGRPGCDFDADAIYLEIERRKAAVLHTTGANVVTLHFSEGDQTMASNSHRPHRGEA